MNLFVLIYAICALISWVVMAGWAFAYWQGYFSVIAKEEKTLDFWFSVATSFVFAIFWPIGEPVMYILTDKARFGWKLRA